MTQIKRRVFQRIQPQWDFDLHVHSNWSQDNLDGPQMQDYVELAERYKIHIGFADHFEFQFFLTDNEKYGKWKLNLQTVDTYLEEIDNLKEQFPFFSSGLEIEYTLDYRSHIENFFDDYKSQFDLFLGSVHEVIPYKAVTLQTDFEFLHQFYGTYENLFDNYFLKIQDLIKSDLFDVVAHPDVVYRYFPFSNFDETYEKKYTEYMLNLGDISQHYKTPLEINLSGYNYAWKDSFPREKIIRHLLLLGNEFLIGSDSHSLDQFKNSIVNTRKMNHLIRNEWMFEKKF